MKHVPKSLPEPPCLGGFRQAQPDATWDEFKDQARNCSETVLGRTVTDQGGICAYCERLLDKHDRQIAHFHPKSDRPQPPNPPAPVNWGLHWENLWLACKGGDQAWMTNPDAFLHPASENRSCDVAKDDLDVDGHVLSPDNIPSFPRIFTYRQRPDRLEIEADDELCQQAGIDPAIAAETIRTFNLNCRRLAEARMRVHAEIERQIKKLRQIGPHAQNLWESLLRRYLERSADGNWKAFFTMVRWRFGNSAESYLQSINYQG